MKRRTTGLLAGVLTVMMGGCSFMEVRVLDFVDIVVLSTLGIAFMVGAALSLRSLDTIRKR